MNKILEKIELSQEVFRMRVHAPYIAEECQPGQFIILQLDTEYGERIPLTIVDANRNEGSITIIFQTAGHGTHLLAELKIGDSIANLVGPLGKPTHIENFGTVVCVGGGIGIGPLHHIAKGMKAAGNKLIVILGARNKELVILEDEMRTLADEIIICTDDGSYGQKALVTAPLNEACQRQQKPD